MSNKIKYVLELTQDEYDWMCAFHGHAICGGNRVSMDIYVALLEADVERCRSVLTRTNSCRHPDALDITRALEFDR